jgi:tetratricopeptide (TPR) repeat protein
MLLIAMGCGLEQPSGPELFEEHFSIDIVEVKTPSEGVAASTMEQQAFRLLQQANYQQAAILFAELAARQRDPGYQVYRGMAQIAARQYTQAIESLSNIPAGHPAIPSARWYQAMAALALDQPIRARSYLEQCIASADRGEYAPRAKNILEKLP